MITVEATYIDEQVQHLREVSVPAGSTVKAVLEKADLMGYWQQGFKLAIFARQVGFDDVVAEGDRVAICRPLTIDPKQARQLRAKRKA